MVKKIILLDKLYNIGSQKQKQREDNINNYRKYLFEISKGFPNTRASIKKLREFDKRFHVIIQGPEEVFIYNLLKKKIGIIKDLSEVKVGDVLKGSLVDVGKVGFGLFVDCGIFNPKVDVLLTLHTLREQLCKGRKQSMPDIINTYDFIDNFPLFIKIKEIDADNEKVQGEVEEQTLRIFRKIVKENIEGVVFTGATKNQLKKAIIRKGHLRDMISIIRYGYLNNIVLFKEGTDAPGIIASVGSKLNNCRLAAIRSGRIKKLLR